MVPFLKICLEGEGKDAIVTQSRHQNAEAQKAESSHQCTGVEDVGLANGIRGDLKGFGEVLGFHVEKRLAIGSGFAHGQAEGSLFLLGMREIEVAALVKGGDGLVVVGVDGIVQHREHVCGGKALKILREGMQGQRVPSATDALPQGQSSRKARSRSVCVRSGRNIPLPPLLPSLPA